jgi:uncharacterized protein
VKLRIEDITAEAKELAFAEPETEANRLLALGPVREYRIDGPISVAVSYYRAGTDVFVGGRIVAETRATCARCVEEFAARRERPIRYVLTPRAAGLDQADAELRIDDVELATYAGDEIDLSPLLREQVLLSLPTRALCDEDCRGLCVRCGANLNLGDCGCRIESMDPRFAALRSLVARRPS